MNFARYQKRSAGGFQRLGTATRLFGCRWIGSYVTTESSYLVDLAVDSVELEGELAVPATATGLVVFAHGSGSSRHSPRNNYVAEVLREHGHGTLLFDLLTEAEDRTRANRFDIDRLTDRLDQATDWVADHDPVADLDVGYFGASTGAAAALRAAARRGSEIDAIVSRGGRVDLAADSLGGVGAPTLFIVGGADREVLELNREAVAALNCEHELSIVEGAGHLFGAPGELEAVAALAGDWFDAHL